MIDGVHAIIYSKDVEATRTFFREVLGFGSVDAGDGWQIFALPPAELGIHPDDAGGRHELYLLCRDIDETVAGLRAKGVEFTSDIADQSWGRLTTLRIPGGGEVGLYEPRHPTPLLEDR